MLPIIIPQLRKCIIRSGSKLSSHPRPSRTELRIGLSSDSTASVSFWVTGEPNRPSFFILPLVVYTSSPLLLYRLVAVTYNLNITEGPHSVTLTMKLFFSERLPNFLSFNPPLPLFPGRLRPNSCIPGVWIYVGLPSGETSAGPFDYSTYITSTDHLIPFPVYFTVLTGAEAPLYCTRMTLLGVQKKSGPVARLGTGLD